jgi:NADH:ubiquinone oxidoreductase subunit 6 (subunit J)
MLQVDECWYQQILAKFKMLIELVKKQLIIGLQTQYYNFLEMDSYFTKFLISTVLVVLVTLLILSLGDVVYKLLLLGLLSLSVVFIWATNTNEFLYAYIGYVVAFTGAVLMLFLSIILMLPVSRRDRAVLVKSNISFVAMLFIVIFAKQKRFYWKSPRCIIAHKLLFLAATPIIIVASVVNGLTCVLRAVFKSQDSTGVLRHWHQIAKAAFAYAKNSAANIAPFSLIRPATDWSEGDLTWQSAFHPGAKRLFSPGEYGKLSLIFHATVYFIIGFTKAWGRGFWLSFYVYASVLTRGIQKSCKYWVLRSEVYNYGKNPSPLSRIALASLISSSILLINAFFGIITFPWNQSISEIGLLASSAEPSGLGAVRDVLYDQQPLLLIITALVLLVALVGAAIFLRHKKK